MPLHKLTYRPGLNREGTNYSNEGGFYDGDKVRFRSGLPEKIGGWIKVASAQFLGICRSLWTWIALNQSNYIGLGTQLKYYIYSGGTYYDITPIVQTDTTTTTPITATNGSPILTIYDGSYNPNVGDYIILSASAGLGGNITTSILDQEFVVTSINISADTYTIVAYSSKTQAGSFSIGASYTIQYIGTTDFTKVGAANNQLGTVFTATGVGTGTGIAGVVINANSSDTGHGGTVTIQYELPVGLAIASVSNGWGTGPWGGGYGSTLVSLTNPFSTNGTTTVTVTQAGHGLTTGNSVFFQSVASNVGGIPAIVMQQAFVVTVTGTNTYTINVALAWPGTITTASSQGGAVVVVVPISPNRGWGTSYNTSTSVGFTTQLRLWSADNFGQDLVLNPRGGAIYYWAASSGVSSRAVPLSTLTQSQTSAITTATFTSGVSTITVTNATGIYPGSYIVSGVNIAAGTYVTSSYVIGSTSVPLSQPTSGASSGNYSFSFSSTAVPLLCNYILTSSIQQFVIAFGTNAYGSSTFNPMTIRWCDQANQYQWTPQVTNQSGGFTLTNGSFIMCAQATRVENLIWTDSCLYTMQYIGYPYVWSFNVLMDNISIMSPNAAITVNNVTYWMGKDKFYVYTGVVSTLPCSIRQYIFDDLNVNQAFQIFAGANEAYNEVWWFYVSNESANSIDKYVIYNYLDKVWSYGTMARTAWLQYGIQPYPIAADYNSRMLYHEVGTDDVSTDTAVPIVSYIQSSDFGIEAGEHFGFIWRLLPDVNFNGSNVNNPSVKMTFYGKSNSGSAPVGSDINTVQSQNNYSSVSEYTVQQYTGQVYTRIRARQIAFNITSTDLGVAWQLGTPRADIKPAGRR